MTNRISKGQEKLKKLIIKKGRMLTEKEALDIYTEHTLKDQKECWNTIDGPTSYDKPWWRIHDSGMSWYRSALGSLLIKGELKLLIG